ncbi:MAG TPA: RsmB/NOP family class I SAM-dependent RNA methyltransferase [Spirochaetota bacterium]|nr:RsmB/NOP family class I SAM-dependent RNA methyltransferase [Spirochaetota bacterium]HOM38593.1 RsmB/NOP family class I SAM-dependent RNA methyltransferase [Spirochaetota bacterium]HPQ49730.1 RsmB/NOP family class I SAM-dependent RNA methyltransferase [Spirochaetota bacterium]
MSLSVSINQIKRILPEAFLNKLYKIYDEHTINKILQGINTEKKTTCRINRLKSDFKEVSEYLKNFNIKFERVIWYKDALILGSNEKTIEKTDIYKEGKIYLQSLSSMIPPLVLEPKENEKILDLAAAPGSKTTQISSITNNTGLITAYELNKIRYEKLLYNINLQGCTNIKPILDNGEKAGEIYENYFDKAIIDAPCSGEGKFRIKNPKTFKAWSEKLVKNSVKIQKKLLSSAIKAVKENGVIVYSTCTLNREENEDIINWALENFNVKLDNININNFNLPTLPTIKGCLKIFQSQVSEGFFVSRIIKVKS